MQRKQFIDWARGFAVVAMVVWHTADSWLLGEARQGTAWAVLRFIGGLAAPSFLFLAGTAAALAAKPDRARPLLLECARGLEIVLLGYMLRLQTWLIDASAVRDLRLVRAWLPLVLGYGALWLALRALASAPARARWLAALGVLAVLVGFVQVPGLAPGRLARLLQVDVLQAIGATLALLALGERTLKLLQRPALALALGACVALVTETLQRALPGALPVPIAAFFGKFAPAPGAPAPALFPLFPWLAYGLVGAAFGTLLRTHADRSERLIVNASVLGALLALLTSESHPLVQLLIAREPWTVHPLRVAYRVGLVAVLLWIGWLWAARDRGRVLLAYGRASLRIYWAHLLIAYGVLGSPWHKQLHVGEWAVRASVLLASMWLLAGIGANARMPRKVGAAT